MVESEVAVIERLVRIETLLITHLDTVKDHEGRIRSLEQAKWKFYGAAVVLAGASSTIATKLLGG